jgi:hypothetical protein
MKYFYSNDLIDYINSDEGKRLEFNKMSCYMLSSVDTNNSIVMIDGGNHIPSIKELNTFILGLTRFVNTYSQESIDEYNSSSDKRMKQQEELSMAAIELQKKERPSKERPGYVYFIADNMNNIKIGLSKNMDSRFKTYTEMPYDPEIIHLLQCSDMVKVEEYFHNKFSNKRFKGEWFKLDDKDIKYIRAGRYSEEIMKFIV